MSGAPTSVRHEGAVGQVQPSRLVFGRQLKYCPTRLGIEWKGAAKLRQMPMAGCHEQSSLNCTRRDPFIVGWATAGSMVRQRSMRRKPLYLATQPSLRNGGRGRGENWPDSLFPASFAAAAVGSFMRKLNHLGFCFRSVTGSDAVDDGVPHSHHPEPPGVEHATYRVHRLGTSTWEPTFFRP